LLDLAIFIDAATWASITKLSIVKIRKDLYTITNLDSVIEYYFYATLSPLLSIKALVLL
jgi:hypothetical protein